MTYDQRLDRLNPGLIVLLIDQSESMLDPLAEGPTSKAGAVAEHLNSLIYELILRCVKTPREPPRPYIHISAITYCTDNEGNPIIDEPLKRLVADGRARSTLTTTDLAAAPLRLDRRPGPTPGSQVNTPVWLDVVAQGGTPMCAAMNRAGALAAGWVATYPNGFPPLIVNLTDGVATDGDPQIWSDRLRSLRTTDGSVLLFNVNLSRFARRPALFPSTPDGLPTDDAVRLWEMSSVLPESMREAAVQHGVDIRPGARGFAFNADVRALATFLNIGTRIGRSLR